MKKMAAKQAAKGREFGPYTVQTLPKLANILATETRLFTRAQNKQVVIEKAEMTDSFLEEATTLVETGIHPRLVVKPKKKVDQSEMGLAPDTLAKIVTDILKQQ